MKKCLRLVIASMVLFIQLRVTLITFAKYQQHGDPPGIVLPVAAHHTYADANPQPIGTDPLSAAELALAQDAAANSILVQQAQASQQRVKFMSAERHDAPKHEQPSQRRADVVFYNYATDQVIRQVVNLQTHVIEATRILPGEGHQPPVIHSEAEAAVQLILAHPTLSQELQQAFLQATGQFLLRASQLQVQGILFVPENLSGTPLSKMTSVCRQHRCIQLFLRADGMATQAMLDVSNVVADLSAGKLLWVDAPFKALVFEGERAPHVESSASHAHEASFTCAIGQPIVITMTIGTRWGLCWAHDPSKGMALSQVSFAPNNGEHRSGKYY